MSIKPLLTALILLGAATPTALAHGNGAHSHKAHVQTRHAPKVKLVKVVTPAPRAYVHRTSAVRSPASLKRLAKQLDRLERQGIIQQGSYLDRYEDRIDRAVTTGRRDIIEDRLDRRNVRIVRR